MARIDGVTPPDAGDQCVEPVLAAQAKHWGAALLNHLVCPVYSDSERVALEYAASISKFDRARRGPSRGLWKRGGSRQAPRERP